MSGTFPIINSSIFFSASSFFLWMHKKNGQNSINNFTQISSPLCKCLSFPLIKIDSNLFSEPVIRKQILPANPRSRNSRSQPVRKTPRNYFQIVEGIIFFSASITGHETSKKPLTEWKITSWAKKLRPATTYTNVHSK